MQRRVACVCACFLALGAGCGGERTRTDETDAGRRDAGGGGGTDAAGVDGALEDASTADGSVSPDAADCDVDGDFVEGAQCGGPDCCDRGDEGHLGCSPETAPRVRPGASEDWYVQRLPTPAPYSLVVDDAGVLHGSVTHEDASTYLAYADGTWTTQRIAGHPRGPQIALGPDGTVHAVYGSRTSVVTWAASLYHATLSGDGWVTEEVGDSVEHGHYAVIAVDGAGVAHLVHSDLIGTRSGSTTVWRPRNLFHSSNAGGTWTTDTIAGWPETPSGRAVAAGNDGNVHVVYYEQEEGVVRYRRRGATLLDETIAAAAPGQLSVVVDAAERPHVVFSAAAGVQYAVRDGDAWTIETVFPEPGVSGSFDGTIALDAADTPHFCVAGEGEIRHVTRTATAYVSETVAPADGRWRCDVAVMPDGAVHLTFGLSDRGYHAFRAPSPGLDLSCDGAD